MGGVNKKTARRKQADFLFTMPALGIAVESPQAKKRPGQAEETKRSGDPEARRRGCLAEDLERKARREAQRPKKKRPDWKGRQWQ
jgi:hypothetical protein